jgi:hypothetical protein
MKAVLHENPIHLRLETDIDAGKRNRQSRMTLPITNYFGGGSGFEPEAILQTATHPLGKTAIFYSLIFLDLSLEPYKTD